MFIDGPNLHATQKILGFDVDYKRLLELFQSRSQVLRAFYYTALTEVAEYSAVRPLVDWLDYNGYTVVTRPRRSDELRRQVDAFVDLLELKPAIAREQRPRDNSSAHRR